MAQIRMTSQALLDQLQGADTDVLRRVREHTMQGLIDAEAAGADIAGELGLDLATRCVACVIGRPLNGCTLSRPNTPGESVDAHASLICLEATDTPMARSVPIFGGRIPYLDS